MRIPYLAGLVGVSMEYAHVFAAPHGTFQAFIPSHSMKVKRKQKLAIKA